MSFFGVYFTADTDIDESIVRKDFSKYGEVVSVRRNHSRVYVNFRFKDDAERCLKDTKNVYGEVKKGSFGPTEQQNSTKENDNSKSNVCTGWNMHSNSDNFERKQRNSLNLLMDSKFESDTTNGDLNLRDSETHKGNKSPMYVSGRPDGKKANDQVSPRGPKNYGRQSAPLHSQKQKSMQNRNSSGNFQEFYAESRSQDGPPPLCSVSASQNPVCKKSTVKSTPVKSPLLPTPVLPNLECRSLLGEPPLALPLKQNEYDSNHPPPLLPAQMSQIPIMPGWSPRDFDQPPPLISSSLPLPNGSKFTEHTRSPVPYEEKKYGTHLLICNVPDDTCPYEIEKVLFPHMPIYVSEPEETNITKNLSFCHVQFQTEEEACKAANQMDGVELRKHQLFMVTLNGLLSNNAAI